MPDLLRYALLALLLSALTGASWFCATNGVGLSASFEDPISVRDGSVGGDRVYIGGDHSIYNPCHIRCVPSILIQCAQLWEESLMHSSSHLYRASGH